MIKVKKCKIGIAFILIIMLTNIYSVHALKHENSELFIKMNNVRHCYDEKKVLFSPILTPRYGNTQIF